MPRSTTSQFATLFVVAVLSAAVGAGMYALLEDDSSPSNNSTSTNSARGLTPPPTTPAAQNPSGGLSVNEIYNREKEAVVEVTANVASGGPQGSGVAQGSGFIYDNDGHVITNQHVVDDASSVTVRLDDNSTRNATVVGSDASTDIAVLKIDGDGLTPIPLADSSKVKVGDPVIAMGSPHGLDDTVTTGIVSALHREISSPNNFTIRDAIQTDAAIDHGSSGGPLLDSGGNVIGINSQIDSSAGSSGIGFGFAVPSNTVRSVASQIISSGKAKHAYLGVGIVTVPPNLADQLGLAKGVELTDVRAGGPAEKAGLKGSTGTKAVAGQRFPVGGDVIISIDGKSTETSDELQSIINGKKSGDTVTVTYIRNGDERTVKVKLGTRPT